MGPRIKSGDDAEEGSEPYGPGIAPGPLPQSLDIAAFRPSSSLSRN